MLARPPGAATDSCSRSACTFKGHHMSAIGSSSASMDTPVAAHHRRPFMAATVSPRSSSAAVVGDNPDRPMAVDDRDQRGSTPIRQSSVRVPCRHADQSPAYSACRRLNDRACRYRYGWLSGGEAMQRPNVQMAWARALTTSHMQAEHSMPLASAPPAGPSRARTRRTPAQGGRRQAALCAPCRAA